MAACVGARPSLHSCSSLTLRGAQSHLLTNATSRHPCGSFRVLVEPLRIARERRRGGVAADSRGGFSSFTDDTPVKDTGVREMVDKQMVDAQQEFSQMDLEEAAEKYNLHEQLFTEVDYCQVIHLPIPVVLKIFC